MPVHEVKLCPLFLLADLIREEPRGSNSPELDCRHELCAWWPMCSALAMWSRPVFVDPEGGLHISAKAEPEETVEQVQELVAVGDGRRVHFSGTLSKSPLQATITFRADDMLVRDDGWGHLGGDVKGGWQNEVADRVFDFAFSQAPRDGSRVSVEYQTSESPAPGGLCATASRGPKQAPVGPVEGQEAFLQKMDEAVEETLRNPTRVCCAACGWKGIVGDTSVCGGSRRCPECNSDRVCGTP